MPDDTCLLLPINRRGQEPCLLDVAHTNWSDLLPARVQDWVDKTYGRPDRNRRWCSGSRTFRKDAHVKQPNTLSYCIVSHVARQLKTALCRWSDPSH